MKLLTAAMKQGIAVVAVLVFCGSLPASASGAGGMSSLAEVSSTLRTLEKGFADVQEKNQLSFELQKGIVVRSGECITRLVDLSQNADLSQDPRRDEFKVLFLKNGELLRRMIAYNQGRIDDVLEGKSGGAADKDAVFTSPEWQQAQYLTLFAGYWQGWNSYYAALLYTERAAARTELLEEAVSGFTRAGINFQEQSFAGRCMLGRALCFKEMKQYDKALEDLQAVIKRASREDSLYAQAGYERALISYQTGKKSLAVKQLQELEETVKPKAMPQPLRDKIKSLESAIALGIAEKKPEVQGSAAGKSEREAAQELKRLADASDAQAPVLYQYVREHAAALATVPEAELGSMGTMAMADWYFERKQYSPAIERYRRLYGAPDTLIKRHLDDICFRLAYALAQEKHWQEALSCLETLFAKFPKSSFDGKAACLYYVAAVRAYQANPVESAYSRYIKAAECYVKNCPDARDKSEAHFQLGLYYQHKNRTVEALREFSLVKSDSPHYSEAQQAGLRSAIEKLQAQVETIENLAHQGRGHSDEAMQLYHEALKQAEGWQKKAGSEADAHMAYLLARLYVYGPEPDLRKALLLLQGFETRYRITRQWDLLCGLAKKLRIECCLQLQLLDDAEKELGSIVADGPVDQATRAFLSECADRCYRQSREAKTNGDASLAAQHAKAALIVYRKLSGIAPADKSLHDHIQLRLAELYADTDQPEQAEALYRQKLEQDPASAEALYRLGLISEKQEKWQDAFSAWQKFSRGLKQGTAPWFEARYREAWALAKLGKQTDACEVIAATRIRFQDFGGGEYGRKFTQLTAEVCGKNKAAMQGTGQ